MSFFDLKMVKNDIFGPQKWQKRVKMDKNDKNEKIMKIEASHQILYLGIINVFIYF